MESESSKQKVMTVPQSIKQLNFSSEIEKLIFILIPAFIYFIVVDKYALNLPSQDDYFAIIDFLNRYKVCHGLDKLGLLFDTHNEHRILSSRIFYVLYMFFFDSINFRHVIFAGNIQLLLTFGIFVAFIRRAFSESWVIPSFVAGICLFDLNNWENANFAMASLQNYGVIFLVACSIYFYSLDKKMYIFLGLIFQIICTYSSGNGIIGSASILFYTLLSRDKHKMILSSIGLIAFAPLYFINFKVPASNNQSIVIYDASLYFLRFVSAHTYFTDKKYAEIAGAFILFGLLILLAVNTSKKLAVAAPLRPFVALLAFLMLSMYTTSLFRYTGGDFPAIRYYIYPHLMMAILLVLLLNRFSSNGPKAIASTIYMCLALYVYVRNSENGINGFVNLNNTLKTKQYYFPSDEVAKTFCDKCCELKIYCIEEARSKIK